MLKNLTLTEYITAVSSASPAPGGGSVSALSGANGAALLEMAVRISEKLLKDDQFKHYVARLAYFKEQCLNLLDEDTQAFAMVMEAYKLPKTNEEEKIIRSVRIQEALRVATETPLRTAENCLALMKLAEEIIAQCKESCISDAACGFYCVEAGLKGALSNVTINLSSLKDEDFKSSVKVKTDALTKWHHSNSPKIDNIIYERQKP